MKNEEYPICESLSMFCLTNKLRFIIMQIKEPRQQLDHMLRQTRMNLVNFSQMADTKAHILLSLSSVLLSLSLTRISEPRLTLTIAGLDVFLLITIFLALLTVIGKVKVVDRKKHSIHDPD